MVVVVINKDIFRKYAPIEMVTQASSGVLFVESVLMQEARNTQILNKPIHVQKSGLEGKKDIKDPRVTKKFSSARITKVNP